MHYELSVKIYTIYSGWDWE